MAKKLYVGNLPYSANDAALADFFAKAGAVESAIVMIDKMTGRSRGFGFVSMVNDDEADKAIESFNGVEMDGRKLTVNEAKPLEKRPFRPMR
ncbi:MAG: RNA-binding protein [Candidatus Paceibacterota bacterium]|jgi:RNA recognition motif-containing protein